MMVDATLELNEAMLQGVKASIDTLNLPENNNALKEKDMQASLIRMKRARDKALLLPYLQEMKDSFTNEIAILKIEKEKLETMLAPTILVQPVEIKTQTLVSNKDTLVFETKTDITSGEKETVVTNISTNEVIVLNDNMSKSERRQNERKLRKYKDLTPLDTVLVYDMGSAIKPEPELKKVPVIDVTEAATANAKPHKEEPQKRPENKPSAKQISKAEALLKKAQKEIEQSNYSAAEQLLQQSIQLQPLYYDAWYELAEMDMAKGLTAKAISEYAQCIGIDSTRADVHFKMGMLYLKSARKKDALLSFSKSLTYQPASVEALMQRAALYTDFKRVFDAIRDYEKVIQIDKTYFAAYKARGLAKMSFRLYDDAYDDFSRYLIFEPEDADCYYYRALCHLANNEVPDGCIDLAIAAKKGHLLAQKVMGEKCK